MNNNNLNFAGLGIAPRLLEVIDRLGFKIPTPIQHKAIPIAIEGKDVIGIAQTGTGKTLAFGIPLIQQLVQRKGLGLILVPTRELAVQVNETIIKLAPAFHMKTAVLIGGEPIVPQINALRKLPRIVIATPGRLMDHVNRHNIRLSEVQILILDEADRMLDMGFGPQIEQIFKLTDKNRQTMIFSATMPAKIVQIASRYMQLPIRTEIAPAGTAAEKISQEIFVVKRDLKEKLLCKILEQYTGSVLLFTRTKIGAKKTARFLRNMEFSSSEIHANRSQSQRKEALEGFKSGKYRILVATDIAARGIDVTGISLVINYDLPDESENYVHRIGRTGRAGQAGHAISFATTDQGRDVKNIETIIRATIPLSQHAEIPTDRFHAPSSQTFSKPSRAKRHFSHSRFGRRR